MFVSSMHLSNDQHRKKTDIKDIEAINPEAVTMTTDGTSFFPSVVFMFLLMLLDEVAFDGQVTDIDH